MNLLAIVGSSRKGKATDTLVDKAIEGALSANPDFAVKKLYLKDHNIQYCKNCLVCRDSKTQAPYGKCSIRDDMDTIYEWINESDRLIFATPLHSGYPTAMMMTFLERTVWIFAKPEGHVLTVSNCPIPRTDKERKAITIITNAVVPPIFKAFCDHASPLFKDIGKSSLNAKITGSLYAGAIELKGVEHYFKKAFDLGKKLI